MVDEPNLAGSPRAARSAAWLLVAVLAAVAGAFLVELGRASSAVGSGLGEPGKLGGMVVVPGQLSRESYGVYLVDPEQGKICVYEYQTAQKQLRLLAVRNFTYDLRLDSYNTQPLPKEMKQLAEQLEAGEVPTTQRAASRPAEHEPSEE